jgi:transcriptional regulator with XRE-family HTH domain
MTYQTNITPEAIKGFRQQKKLSQQQLASILNVGVGTISRWENGLKPPSGTAAAVLESLLSHGPANGVGPVASGYSIYVLLKERFEGREQAHTK